MPDVPILQKNSKKKSGCIYEPNGKLIIETYKNEELCLEVMNCVQAMRLMAAEQGKTAAELSTQIMSAYIHKKGPIKLMINVNNDTEQSMKDGYLFVRGPGDSE